MLWTTGKHCETEGLFLFKKTRIAKKLSILKSHMQLTAGTGSKFEEFQFLTVLKYSCHFCHITSVKRIWMIIVVIIIGEL